MSRSVVDLALERIQSGQARIPVFDDTAARAQRILGDGRFEIDELEALVNRDPALASALLRAANSATYGGVDKALSVRDAVLRLGARKTCQLVVVLSQKQSYRMREPALQRMAESLWRHSLACAFGCDWLARRLRLRALDASAVLAGLLHDVGKLFLIGVVDDLVAGDPSAAELPEPLLVELTRTLHCAHGERLLEAWELPELYRAIARRHHDEAAPPDDALLQLVRLVDQVCNRMGIGLEPTPEVEPVGLPEAHALGASDVVLADLEVHLEDALQVA